MTGQERRLAIGANVLAALTGAWMLINPNDRILGPAFDDDVPYGFLVQLETVPAVIVLILGVLGVGAVITGRREALLGVGAGWLLFAAWAFLAMATEEHWYNLQRAGNTGMALAVGLCTALPWLITDRSVAAGGSVRTDV